MLIIIVLFISITVYGTAEQIGFANDISDKLGETFLPASLTADTLTLVSHPHPPPPFKIPPELPVFYNYSTNSTDADEVVNKNDPDDNESNELTNSLGNGQSTEHSTSSSKTYEISIISISSFLVLGVIIAMAVLYHRYRNSASLKLQKLPMIEPGSPAVQRNPMSTHFVAP